MNNVMENLINENLIKNYNKYYRLAYSYVHNESDAMDIVQEGAYKAILKSESLKSVEYIDTWIYRIMINEALGFLRKNKRESREIQEEDLISKDTYQDVDLRKSIDMLPPTERAIITLRYFEDLEISQIAEIVDENMNTVKTKLYRTLKKLQLKLLK
ncbi:RNA polymerase sigma factor [Asaccharospora irregularis]|uniref:RNA polymerase, sigma subunit, SigV n=1 Tax=Asaccharospora irregularis DSM 2635 TaxID=1121321 RepID=A0A1M5JJ00_9FIRM|nr:sigma-70 family RNA polymerase sigma factor [Asaccharospora irregularis]SHG40375.1 RNA polymerase, sigma subunit, SigV [Asaccharospora irregularis DSM 2635]